VLEMFRTLHEGISLTNAGSLSYRRSLTEIKRQLILTKLRESPQMDEKSQRNILSDVFQEDSDEEERSIFLVFVLN